MRVLQYDGEVKPAKRLPRRFRRPVSSRTQTMVQRRYQRQKQFNRERWRRLARRVQNAFKAWRRKALRWSIAFAFLFGLLFTGFALFSPIIEVREIQVQRTDVRLDIEQVQTVLASLFGEHLFFLAEGDVAALLREQIPDIEDVQVAKRYPSTLLVRVSLEPFVAKLAIVSPDAASAEQTGTGSMVDYLTGRGVYIASSRADETEPLPIIRLVDWGVRPVAGSALLSPAFLERMTMAERALQQQFGLGVEQRTVYLRAQEFHLDVGGYTLWFDIRSPLEAQLQRYRTFLRSVQPGEITEYVDLRLADRVVYK